MVLILSFVEHKKVDEKYIHFIPDRMQSQRRSESVRRSGDQRVEKYNAKRAGDFKQSVILLGRVFDLKLFQLCLDWS